MEALRRHDCDLVINLGADCEVEEDGRWIAEIAAIPGVLAYGVNRKGAILNAQALALRVIAERLEYSEVRSITIQIHVPA